jgi:DNA-3-methyladenine glycosylase II
MNKIEFSIGTEAYKELIKKEPLFQRIIEQVGSISITLHDDYFQALLSAIISQQLSGKVARVIEERVEHYFKHSISPDKILLSDDEELRKLGLSYQKIKYLKSLAACITDQSIHFNNIEQLSDQEIINMLVKVKGIGVWTAQMFLIFALGRMDVFSCLDLGLRNGVKKLYQNQDLSNDQIEEISKYWSPHRTMASLYLWKMID